MKNISYLFALLTLFAWSCSDKEVIEPEVPTYEVSFSFAAAQSSLMKSSSIAPTQPSTAASIFDWVQYLDLYVYDDKGKLINHFRRWGGIGEMILQSHLKQGEYTAVAIGHAGSVLMSGFEKLSTAHLSQFYQEQIYIDKVVFNVGATEAGEVGMVLERKAGRLEFDITDKPMNRAQFVRVTMNNMASDYSIQANMPKGNDWRRDLMFYVREGMEHYSDFPAYFFVPYNSTSYKTSILLEVVDGYGVVVKSQLLQDVTIGINRKTTIRGKLYDAHPHDFSIDIDDAWSGEDIIDF